MLELGLISLLVIGLFIGALMVVVYWMGYAQGFWTAAHPKDNNEDSDG